MGNQDYTVYSGGLKGAEAMFGECAQKHGINEINFSFKGHKCAREKNITMLSDEELKKGNQVTLEQIKEYIQELEQIRNHYVNNNNSAGGRPGRTDKHWMLHQRS